MKPLFLKSLTLLFVSFLLVAAVLLTGCAVPETTVITPTPVTSRLYRDIEPRAQVPPETVRELEQKYPPGFWENGRGDLSDEQKKRVTVKLFSSATSMFNEAKFVTEVFVSVFSHSPSFIVVEREELDHVTSEFELNQSGLMNQEAAPETGEMETAEVVVTGDLIQLGNESRLEARVIDIKTGRILLTEQSHLPVITIQAAEMLARRVIFRLEELVYPQ